MKTLLVINTHSVIDVITNSSSELFVCQTEQTIEAVKEMLRARGVDGVEDPWIFNLQDYREWRTLQQYKTQKDWDHHFAVIEGWFYDPQNEDDLRDLRNEHIDKYNSPWHDRLRRAAGTAAGWENRDAELKKIYEELEYSSDRPDWWMHPWEGTWQSGSSVETLNGCVMIESEGDNTVDYEHWGWIEGTFNARRYHLG